MVRIFGVVFLVTGVLMSTPAQAQWFWFGWGSYDNSYESSQDNASQYGYSQDDSYGESSGESSYSSSTPIEIYLSSRYGRFGSHEFYALGGRDTHPTPRGTFTVKSTHESFYSRKYKSSMPLSIFFTDQCAIHVGSLRVSSHGCIHVDRETAELLFQYARPGVTRVRVYE